MDDVTKERTFDPFFTTKAGVGGLGMSEVLGIVKANGGALSLESQKERGTRIRVFFPARESRQAMANNHEPTSVTTGTIMRPFAADPKNPKGVSGKQI
jgi:hypothetical protein